MEGGGAGGGDGAGADFAEVGDGVPFYYIMVERHGVAFAGVDFHHFAAVEFYGGRDSAAPWRIFFGMGLAVVAAFLGFAGAADARVEQGEECAQLVFFGEAEAAEECLGVVGKDVF